MKGKIQLLLIWLSVVVQATALVIPYQPCKHMYVHSCVVASARTRRSHSLLFESGGGSKAKVRFSGVDLEKQGTSSSPVDRLLSLMISDVGSIGIGITGLILLLVGRLILDSGATTSVEGLGQETRTNLLAAFATGSVLLNGVSKLDVESIVAEPVNLQGQYLEDVRMFDKSQDKPSQMLSWTLQSLVTTTPAKTAVSLQLIDGTWNVEAAVGIVPSTLSVPPSSPILDRFRQTTLKETYLPTLQALPGRVEFTYLPVNTQAALLVPVNPTSVLVLGSHQAKSFTPRHIAWCQSIAARLGNR